MIKSKEHGMGCPMCASRDTKVLDSRAHGNGIIHAIRRRRECGNCRHRFSTIEITREVFEQMQDLEDNINRVRADLEQKMMEFRSLISVPIDTSGLREKRKSRTK